MKKYIKDNVIINDGTPITIGDTIYYHPTATLYARAGWVEYVEPVHVRTLEEAKAEKVKAIDAFDVSESVNGFYVNGQTMWIAKADRVGLVNSTTILKESGEDTCTLWANDRSYTLSCDRLLDMLAQVEKYALTCYNVTARHKAQVNAMADIESVDAFNVSGGYPEQLNFTI